MELITNIFTDYTLRSVVFGSAILGIVSGALGSFAVLRGQSLLGDAISHTALPGVALAFLITGSRHPLWLLLGAALAGWAGTLIVMGIIGKSRVKQDSALGMVLAVLFGFGLVLMSYVQRTPEASKAGLDKFLFGQASTLMTEDIYIMGILGSIAIFLMILFWKELKILSFDREFGTSMGFKMRSVDILLTTLLVIAIVIGLQTVGVVLMSAMVVAPAAAARQWTDRLGVMVFLSAVFGAMGGVSGAIISSMTAKLPTGPTAVLCISTIVLISLLFAPNRGLIYRQLGYLRNRRELTMNSVLLDLLELAQQHNRLEHPHPINTLKSMSSRPERVEQTLLELLNRGLVNKNDKGLWFLTSDGQAHAGNQYEKMGAKS